MALNFQKQTTGTPLHTNSPFPDSRSQDMLTKLSSQPFFIAHENSIPTALSSTISPTPSTSCKNNGSTILASESLHKNSLFIRDSISDNIPDSVSDNIPDKIPSLSTPIDNIRPLSRLNDKIDKIITNQPLQPTPTDITSRQPPKIPNDNIDNTITNQPLPTSANIK
ncbi:35944_t:CDS:2, partial [Racocetra persica]